MRMRQLLVAAVVAGSATAYADGDVFRFHDLAGFQACLALDHLVVTVNTGSGTQTQFLGPTEIQPRCVSAAVQLLAPAKKATDVTGYVAATLRASVAANAIDLVDLVARVELVGCNDTNAYEVLARVLENPPGADVSRAKVVVKRCLKDATFRKDFRDELHSGDKHLAANACEILREEKLVSNCRGNP
jgi:hypothetical protein